MLHLFTPASKYLSIQGQFLLIGELTRLSDDLQAVHSNG
jgi:hypothetical protein